MTDCPDSCQTLVRAEAPRLAYVQTRPAPGTAPQRPGVVFLGGFRSAMAGTKAVALERHCGSAGLGYLRLDYRGHGRSDGRFEDGTIGLWTEDALAVMDAVLTGPQVLVGSSMGAWIALLCARRALWEGARAGGADQASAVGGTGTGTSIGTDVDASTDTGAPARRWRPVGLMGLAAAVDFTEDLIWSALDDQTRSTLLVDGLFPRPSQYEDGPYPITLALVEEARAHLLLRGPLALDLPVRLIHGMADADVPWRQSLKLIEVLESPDARLELIKDGDHRLARPADLDLITARLDALVDAVGG